MAIGVAILGAGMTSSSNRLTRLNPNGEEQAFSHGKNILYVAICDDCELAN
jgi:hypothetical protein